jgi:hypothetical protein
VSKTIKPLQALRFADTAAFPWALKQRWLEEWQGFPLYCLLFLHAQKAFFTLRFAREVENSWSMREICQINIQELYRSAAEMDDYCAKHADASPAYTSCLMHPAFAPWPIAWARS